MISVCIPTVRPTTIADAIGSVLRQSYPDWELWVVGQGDDPTLAEEVERVRRRDPRVRYVHVEIRNASLARNTAIDRAGGELIALLDDDCEAAPDWLETLQRCFRDEPDTGVVGGAVIAPPPERWGFSTCPENRPREALYDPVAAGFTAPLGCDWLSANVAVRRSVIERVGPFDPCLGPGTPFAAAEDPDWKLRIEKLGITMRATPRSVVYHTHGRRYGLREGHAHLRNYARGNGALAAKLTLQGDRRGAERLRALWTELGRSPLRLPNNLLRVKYMLEAYDLCLRDYRLEPTGRLLEKKA